MKCIILFSILFIGIQSMLARGKTTSPMKLQEQNGKTSDIKTTTSEPQFEDTVTGTGTTLEKGQKAKVHYSGTLLYGKKCNSPHDRNQPFECTLGVCQVIKGWDEDVLTMSLGGQNIHFSSTARVR